MVDGIESQGAGTGTAGSRRRVASPQVDLIVGLSSATRSSGICAGESTELDHPSSLSTPVARFAARRRVRHGRSVPVRCSQLRRRRARPEEDDAPAWRPFVDAVFLQAMCWRRKVPGSQPVVGQDSRHERVQDRGLSSVPAVARRYACSLVACRLSCPSCWFEVDVQLRVLEVRSLSARCFQEASRRIFSADSAAHAAGWLQVRRRTRAARWDSRSASDRSDHSGSCSSTRGWSASRIERRWWRSSSTCASSSS